MKKSAKFDVTVHTIGVSPSVSKKRYNIWLDTTLIDEVKKASQLIGVKTSTFMRMAILEKLKKNND